MMRDTLDTNPPQDEATSGKAWNDPSLVEFDVDSKTAISPAPTEDGMGGGS